MTDNTDILDLNAPARWDEYKYFKKQELDCKHTGLNEMKHSFMLRLEALRAECGFALRIVSGYRDVSHPIERAKVSPGTHTLGVAADIAVSHIKAHKVLEVAMRMGFSGIGINQKGSGTRFIHLDDADQETGRPRPHVWSY